MSQPRFYRRGNDLAVIVSDLALMITQKVRDDALDFPRHAREWRCRRPQMHASNPFASLVRHAVRPVPLSSTRSA